LDFARKKEVIINVGTEVGPIPACRQQVEFERLFLTAAAKLALSFIESNDGVVSQPQQMHPGKLAAPCCMTEIIPAKVEDKN
jgi:hypothetical protein